MPIIQTVHGVKKLEVKRSLLTMGQKEDLSLKKGNTSRFRERLSTLQLTALQQHITLLAPALWHYEKQLTAFDLERLFKPDLSPSGSNRGLKESQTMGYWAAYLLDCEEGQAALSVEDVLMFATGLSSPSGLEPLPQIEFLDDSAFPIANTVWPAINRNRMVFA